ncbi:hypothetical protein EDC01DRAFT_615636 [Geopyxis carbonaria]|nr:hypothetical protein EDC01DRAFT_615636 [Geopyxis carbonaria]
MDTQQITRALDYVSRELRRRKQHIHLVLSGEALSCLQLKTRNTCRTLSILIATRLSSKGLGILARAVQKATKKFSLGANWFNINCAVANGMDSPLPSPSPVPKHQQFCKDDLIHRSLIQNDVLYTTEGLTIVAVDHCYALKASLVAVTNSYYGARSSSLDDPLATLSYMVQFSRGRPLTRGYIRRCYPHLEVEDSLLLRLNSEYEAMFGTRGVVGLNDEYLGWRREGMNWSPEMDEYTRELATNLHRRRTSIDSDTTPVSPVYNWEPECSEDIVRIFAEKGLYD